jgi:long-chain acyl-CoA synthetase
VFTARFDPKSMLGLLEAESATIFDGVPTMYALLLAEPGLAEADLSTLRLCTVGGQVMPQATADAWIARTGVAWAEVWGMTESCGFATTHPLHCPRAPGSVGVSAPGVEVRIADVENSTEAVADGVDGEMQIRGPIVMTEYLNSPEATAETILPGGWLRTGDIGHRDAAGNLYVVDRLNDLIITGGFNVYPAEIERVVAKHPAVALCGVVAAPDEVKGEIAHAFVVLRPGATATAADIVAHCRESLAAYKIPRRVSFVDDLPHTSTGKILRRELRAHAR